MDFRCLIVGVLLSFCTVISGYSYQVTFNAGTHGVIVDGEADQVVEQNISAVAPTVIPAFSGYSFAGWDKSFNDITSDTDIKAVYSKTISLSAGQHLFSPNFDISSEKVLDICESSLGAKSYVRNAAGHSVRKINNQWTNSIGTWNSKEGYVIGLDESTVLNLSGVSADFSGGVQLKHGYNLVPYIYDVPMNIEDYFQSVLGAVIYIKDISGNYYSNSTPEDVFNLQPGQSYLVKTHESAVFTPPAVVSHYLSPSALSLSAGESFDILEQFSPGNSTYELTLVEGPGLNGISIDNSGVVSIPTGIETDLYVLKINGNNDTSSLFLILHLFEYEVVEYGATFDIEDYFASLYGSDNGARYTLTYADELDSSFPPAYCDAETGLITPSYFSDLLTPRLRVTRTTPAGVSQVSEFVFSFSPVSIITLDDIYVYHSGQTIEEALKRAVAEVDEGGVILFDLSDALIESLYIPNGYNRDFDGDYDIYVQLNEDLLIEKDLTIVFDTDGRQFDRDVILVSGGIKIQGALTGEGGLRETPTVCLSQFAVVEAPYASVFHDGGIVYIEDADLAYGSIAYQVFQNDYTSDNTNEAYLTNVNIYGNNTMSGAVYDMAADQATIYLHNIDRFKMTNAFIGDNSFNYGLIRGHNVNTLFTNVTIANNMNNQTVRGEFIDGGNFVNTTITENVILHYHTNSGQVEVPIFIKSSEFMNSFVVGNLMSFYYDDGQEDTIDDRQDGGVVTKYNPVFFQTPPDYNNYIANAATYTGPSFYEFIGYYNGHCQFIIVDGVIHYVDILTMGADEYFFLTKKYSGSSDISNLKTILQNIRSTGYDELTQISR